MNILLNARERAEEMVRAAEREAAAAQAEARNRTIEQLESKKRQARAQARLAAQRTNTRARQQLIDRLWDDAVRELRSYHARSEGERLDSLAHLALDAAAQLAQDDWELEIAVTEADQSLLTEENLRKIAARLREFGVKRVTLAGRAEPIWGGLVARKIGGRQIVDNSFNERLALVQRTLRDRIARRLSGEQSDNI